MTSRATWGITRQDLIREDRRPTKARAGADRGDPHLHRRVLQSDGKAVTAPSPCEGEGLGWRFTAEAGRTGQRLREEEAAPMRPAQKVPK